jgi:hypothetical protein
MGEGCSSIKNLGLIEGKGTNGFDPGLMIRAEALTALLRMLAQL